MTFNIVKETKDYIIYYWLANIIDIEKGKYDLFPAVLIKETSRIITANNKGTWIREVDENFTNEKSSLMWSEVWKKISDKEVDILECYEDDILDSLMVEFL